MKKSIKTQAFNTRQKMNSKTFEIFRYKDARLKYVPIHNHDFYEIYLFIKGQVDYRIESDVYKLNQTNLLLIPPNIFHQPIIRGGETYERIVLWINKDYLHSIIDSQELLNCFTNENYILESTSRYDEIATVMQYLINGIDDESQVVKDSFNKSMLLLLFVLINRLSKVQNSSKLEKESNPTVAKILSYINDNYLEDISLDSISDYFYLNKYYLSHLFTQETGTTIYAYIIKRRLVYAKELLLNGYSPKETCKKSGFGDYTNFYRTYKNEYGVTPKENYIKR